MNSHFRKIKFTCIHSIVTFLAIGFYFANIGAQDQKSVAESYYKKGLQAKSSNEKIKQFSKALELDTTFIEAAYQLGITYYQKGFYEQAIEFINKAIKIDSSAFAEANLYLINAYTFYASELNENENYELAAATAQQALEMNENFAPALTVLGFAQFNLHNWQAAINTLEKSIKLNSNQETVWTKLGDLYLRTKDYLHSIEACENALKIDPNLKEAYVHLNIAKKRMSPESVLEKYEEINSKKNMNEAIAYLKKAQLIYPENVQISTALSEAIQEQDYIAGVQAMESENWHLALEKFQRLDLDYKDSAQRLEEAKKVIAAEMDSTSNDLTLEKSKSDSAALFTKSQIAYKDKIEKPGKKEDKPGKALKKETKLTQPISKNEKFTTRQNEKPPEQRTSTSNLDSLRATETIDSSAFANQIKKPNESDGSIQSFVIKTILWAVVLFVVSLIFIRLTVFLLKRKPKFTAVENHKGAKNKTVSKIPDEAPATQNTESTNQTDEIFQDKIASITPVKFDPIDAAEVVGKTNHTGNNKSTPLKNEVLHMSETETLIGGVKKIKNIGRYIVEKELGKGSMGQVFKAWDPKLDRAVVIKQVIFDFASDQSEIAKMKNRLYREARAAGKLNHPNIVVIYDVNENENFSYIVMEYLDGQDLKIILEREKILILSRAINIIKQICSALHFAHQNGIVHRDIKPSNIILTEQNKVKVADFGIAQLPFLDTLTQTGNIIGTPFYMSPEQVEGRKLDGRSDIFSVGVLLYEMLTATHPFTGDSIASIVYKIIHQNPKSPSQINKSLPDSLDFVFKRALAKKPDERYTTAFEFYIELEQFQKQELKNDL